MKIIVETETKLAKYAVEDDVAISSTAENITVGDPVQFSISDLNETNSTVYADITNTPDDWAGNKYKFSGTKWTANSDYVEPPEDDDGE